MREDEFEDGSFSALAWEAWHQYNPDWLIDRVNHKDEKIKGMFVLEEVSDAFREGFRRAMQYQITGELPNDEI